MPPLPQIRINVFPDHTRGPGADLWTAPEVLRGGPHSTASDAYAFGLLLFELFAGERIFARQLQYMARISGPPHRCAAAAATTPAAPLPLRSAQLPLRSAATAGAQPLPMPLSLLSLPLSPPSLPPSLPQLLPLHYRCYCRCTAAALPLLLLLLLPPPLHCRFCCRCRFRFRCYCPTEPASSPLQPAALTLCQDHLLTERQV